ncbi:MAG: hypothetical protein R3E68_22905 [Burkholderiaceae bacterium]
MIPRALLLALAMGDPAGISPELTARLVADGDGVAHVRLLVVGDARILAMGAEQAGLGVELPDWQDGDQRPAGHAMLDLGHLCPGRGRPGQGDAGRRPFRDAQLHDGAATGSGRVASMR